MEQALVFGQSAPTLGRRLADAVLFRTVEYRLTEQIEQYRQVVSPVAFVQEFFGQVIQPPLRYFHEERTDVYFQDIAIPRVVLGAEPDMFFHPFYAVERTLSLAGTVLSSMNFSSKSGTSLWAMRWCTTRSRKSAAKISRFTGLLIMKAMEREGRYVPALISRHSSTHLVRNRSRRQGHCRYCVSFYGTRNTPRRHPPTECLRVPHL